MKEYRDAINNHLILKIKKRTGKGSDWHISLNPRKLKELYEMIIQIDPNLPSYQAFIKFMQEYNTAVQEYRQDFLKDVVSEAYSAADMLNIGISKAFELGNIVMGETLEEIKMKLQEGESIPRKDKQMIMSWFRSAGMLHISGQTLKLKGITEARNTMALALLARSARAGNLNPDDVELNERGEELNNASEKSYVIEGTISEQEIIQQA